VAGDSGGVDEGARKMGRRRWRQWRRSRKWGPARQMKATGGCEKTTAEAE